MLSIIVCTYRRPTILRHCLASLISQTATKNEFEVVVVDNALCDLTRQVVDFYTKQFSNFRYVPETVVGLSNARNRGFQEAHYEFVAYVDDDSKVFPDFVERALKTFLDFDFSCFGGVFFPWYTSKKPLWLADSFGAFPYNFSEPQLLESGKHAIGCVILFKRQCLISVGGFPADLGMNGLAVGYGEENWVQDKFRELGYSVGIDPGLMTWHLVADYKFTVWWHLKRMFAKGWMERRIKKRVFSNLDLLRLFFRSLGYTTFTISRKVPMLVLSKKYYWQNFVLDSFGYLFKVAGFIRG